MDAYIGTIDTCAIPTKTQFCDEDEYDIVAVRMIKVVNVPNSKQTKILETQPLEVEVESFEKEFTYYSKEKFSKESTQATEETYEKLRELKLHRL